MCPFLAGRGVYPGATGCGTALPACRAITYPARLWVGRCLAAHPGAAGQPASCCLRCRVPSAGRCFPWATPISQGTPQPTPQPLQPPDPLRSQPASSAQLQLGRSVAGTAPSSSPNRPPPWGDAHLHPSPREFCHPEASCLALLAHRPLPQLPWVALRGPGPQPRPWGWGQALGARPLGEPLVPLQHLSPSPVLCPCRRPWDAGEGRAVSAPPRFAAAPPR